MSKWRSGNVSTVRVAVAVQVVVMSEGRSSVDGTKVKGRKESSGRSGVC